MKTQHALLPTGYLKLFTYYDWEEGNQRLLDVEKRSSNFLREWASRGQRQPAEKRKVASFDQFCDTFMNGPTGADAVGLAFRGQSSDWPLQSQLQRFWAQFDDHYHRHACSMGDLRNIPCWRAGPVNEIVGAYLDQDGKALRPQADQLWAILQHYGAPTPLLDWTLSLDVALFFAFEAVPQDQDAAWVHMLDIGKMHAAVDASLTSRDALLDADYTKYENAWTVVWPQAFGDIRFATQQGLFTYQKFRHATDMLPLEAYLNTGETSEQGSSQRQFHPATLVSVGIPASERPVVMRYLEQQNVTRRTLFPDWERICAEATSRYRDALLSPRGPLDLTISLDTAAAIVNGRQPDRLGGNTQDGDDAESPD